MRHTIVCLLAVFVFHASLSAAEKMPKVADGFTIEKVAASPLVKHPMMAGFDDRGRLFIAESAGKNLRAADLLKEMPNFIRMIEDTDGDGRFDKSTIFADKMSLPMGALWYRGALYVAAPPSIWRLEDTDGDGVADKRDELVNNFGFSGNAASVHGCFLGPDGRIYWCDGRHGHEFRDKNGKVTSGGLASRIFSCKPDGSDIQVHCAGGMDNPVEIDFLPTGEMLGTVNILLVKPRVDCLMHWVHGGAYPHYATALPELTRTGDLLQPMTKLGHVAVSGMMRVRSSQLGKEFKNNIFLTQFNNHRIVRSEVARSGATFSTKQHEFVVSEDPDVHFTDVLEDADGSLLVIDTGGWFRIGCPVSQVAKPDIHGAIYRVRKKNSHRVDDSRGRKIAWKSLDADALIKLLDDERFAVREKAIDQFATWLGKNVRRDKIREAMQPNHPERLRRNVRWAIARVKNEPAATALRGPLAHVMLADKAESVRIATLRCLRDCRVDHVVAAVISVLKSDSSAAVKREAADTLGILLRPKQRISSTVALSDSENIEARERGKRYEIVETVDGKSLKVANWTSTLHQSAIAILLETLRQPFVDRTLEHAVIYAVISTNDRKSTLAYLNDSSPNIRRAALLALDQMYQGELTREQVVSLLDTDDNKLQTEALRIISEHEGWADETVALLTKWLRDQQISQQRATVLRGFLLAQSDDEGIQTLIAESLADDNTIDDAALLLLEVMQRSSLKQLPNLWEQRLGDLLHHQSAEVRLQTIRTLQTRQLGQFDQQLKQLARDKQQPTELRIEAIGATSTTSELESDLFNFLNAQLTTDIAPLAKVSAARGLARASLSDDMMIQLAEQIGKGGPIVGSVLLRAYSKSKSEKVGMAIVQQLKQGKIATVTSAAELSHTLQSYPQTVKTAAAPLFSKLGDDAAKQQARLNELLPKLIQGDIERGRAVFFGKKAACSSCHTIAGQGSRVGPDLSGIGAIRTRRDLLESIVMPSATFAREFRPVIVQLEDGNVHNGLITRQSADNVFLRKADLSEHRISRDSIEGIRESNVSIMPQGLEKLLSEQELRDLLAFLANLKETAKSPN
ncbi:MAG: hypothetical protein CMJ78_23955 [Planctomycetaceae bacterium]|nr:hypothetical protein [Planctomycetaceae bacterium]